MRAGSHAGGAAGGSRNLNYSNPDVREWYQQQMQHYHTINGGAAPVEFWWNDEGEADYFVFHFWNAAEIVVSPVPCCRVHRTPRPFPVLAWPSRAHGLRKRKYGPGLLRTIVDF